MSHLTAGVCALPKYGPGPERWGIQRSNVLRPMDYHQNLSQEVDGTPIPIWLIMMNKYMTDGNVDVFCVG